MARMRFPNIICTGAECSSATSEDIMDMGIVDILKEVGSAGDTQNPICSTLFSTG